MTFGWRSLQYTKFSFTCTSTASTELRFGATEYKLEELISNAWRARLLLKYRHGWDWHEVDVTPTSKGKMRKEVRRNYPTVKTFIAKDWSLTRDSAGLCVIWNDRFGMEKCSEMTSGRLWDKAMEWLHSQQEIYLLHFYIRAVSLGFLKSSCCFLFQSRWNAYSVTSHW